MQVTSTFNYPRLMHSREQEFDERLGPRSRFGDGDGSFWDRWLVSTSIGIVNGDEYQHGKEQSRFHL